MPLEDQLPTRDRVYSQRSQRYADPTQGINPHIWQSAGNPWEGTAKQIKAVSDTIVELQLQQQKIYAEARAQDLTNQMRTDINAELRELFSLQKQDAITYRSSMDEKLQKIRTKYLSQTGKDDPIVRQLLDRSSTRAVFEASNQADAYVMEQSVAYREATNQAAVSLAAEDAAANYGTAMYEQSKREFDAALDKMLDERGFTPGDEGWQEAQLKAYDELHGSSIAGQIDLKDYGGARKALKQFKGEMRTETWTNLWARLKRAEEAEYKSRLSEQQAALNAEIGLLEKNFERLKKQGDADAMGKIYTQLKQLKPLDQFTDEYYRQAIEDTRNGDPLEASNIAAANGFYAEANMLRGAADNRGRYSQSELMTSDIKQKAASIKDAEQTAERAEKLRREKANALNGYVNSLSNLAKFDPELFNTAMQELNDGFNEGTFTGMEYATHANNLQAALNGWLEEKAKEGEAERSKTASEGVRIIKAMLERGDASGAQKTFEAYAPYMREVNNQEVLTEFYNLEQEIIKTETDEGIKYAKSLLANGDVKGHNKVISGLLKEKWINGVQYSTLMQEMEKAASERAEQTAELRSTRGMSALEEAKMLKEQKQKIYGKKLQDFRDQNEREPNENERQRMELEAQQEGAQLVKETKDSIRAQVDSGEAAKQSLINQAFLALKGRVLALNKDPYYQLPYELQTEIEKNPDNEEIIKEINGIFRDSHYNADLSRIIDEMPRDQLAAMSDAQLIALRERYGGNVKNIDEMFRKRSNAQYLSFSNRSGITEEGIKQQLIEMYDLDTDDALQMNKASNYAAQVFEQVIKDAADPVSHQIDTDKAPGILNNILSSRATIDQFKEERLELEQEALEVRMDLQGSLRPKLPASVEAAIIKYGKKMDPSASNQDILNMYYTGQILKGVEIEAR